jgi:hypothetical protein
MNKRIQASEIYQKTRFTLQRSCSVNNFTLILLPLKYF